jgi:hypothetical protein
VLQDNLDRDVTGLTQSVIEAVNQYTGAKALPDDICLVAVEVATSPKRAAAQSVETGATS